uniref:cAMP-responsive element modulator-like n=1 Tax=Gasterosteus aculeatus aculeatus TaxID=481459 RepID=UPI001A9A29FF|nr:cAMP-responsive element modulator-like [Gasterosteus aculeatus aculeatus]XP_040026730.1 cAMP-responsive element modulator-like [Gasterosteus aculeatus aculeatus]
MESSAPPRPDGGLNGLATDGEENRSEGSPQAAAECDGQTVQLQGVIQAPQTSVIQSPHLQTVQIGTVAELDEDESVTDSQKRRVLLSRRPSYRKILNELSSDSRAAARIDEEMSEEEEDEEEEEEEEEVPVSSAASASVPTSIYQTSSGQYIAITHGGAVQLTGPGMEAFQGAQTMTVGGSHAPQHGATILQCAAQPGDSPQQFYIQGGQVLVQAATGDIPAYQLRSPNSGLAHSIVMAASPGTMQNPPQHHSEDITRKREVRLMKNR